MKANNTKDIRTFFAGYAASFRIFRALKRLIEQNGKTRITVSKTQIAFGEEYNYAWVWLPQKWITKRSPESITLTLLTGKALKHPRVTESVQARPGYWTHHIVIGSAGEIDEDLSALIRTAYLFQIERKLAKKTPYTKTGSEKCMRTPPKKN